MDAMDLLLTRASNGKLGEPAPDDHVLTRVFEAAARTPDHGCMRPWRIHVVRGDARRRLGDRLAALVARQPGASPEAVEKARGKPLRAPLILVVSAVVTPNPKVPAIEQVLAAGAAAHTLLLALQANGFAGIWRTGDPAYSDEIKRAFGLGAADALVGFLYVGTPTVPAPTLKRPAVSEFVREWDGVSD